MDLERKRNITKSFFIHQITIKILHFQTTKRMHHKDLDDYYAKFSDNMDKFVECMSFDGRLNFQDLKLNISVPTSVVDFLKSELTSFISLADSFEFQEDQGLLVIVQDMIIDVQRTIYLLTAD